MENTIKPVKAQAMSTADDAEKASRILALAQVILKASESLEDSDWQSLQTHVKEAGRMARVLELLDKKREIS